MERKPDSINRISETRIISHETTKKLRESHKINRNSKKAIWQEEMKSTRTEGKEQCVVGS